MEESTKNFINAVIFSSQVFPGLKDRFLYRKLYEKLFVFVFSYSKKGERDVAQYYHEVLKATESLLDILDYIEHSKSASATSLLYARRNLFLFKLFVIKNFKAHQTKTEPEKAGIPAEKIKLPAKPVKKEINITGNKERILNYIKRSPNSRTKDIIYEFSILSERTVKRNLKELVSSGLVRKTAKDKAVMYHIV